MMPQGRLPAERPTNPSYELLTPLKLPSDSAIEANRFVAEGNKLLDEHKAKLEEIAAIKRAIAAGEVADDDRVPATRSRPSRTKPTRSKSASISQTISAARHPAARRLCSACGWTWKSSRRRS
jgi:hypothetical protein